MEVAVRIPCGGLDLEGRVLLPRAPALGVVLCHPHPLLGGDMSSTPVVWLRDVLAARGAAVLRFNFRGTGGSGGRHGGGTEEVGDVHAAVRFLRERSRGAPVAVVGYSFGAAMAAQAALEEPELLALGLVAPPLATQPLPPLRATDFRGGIVLALGDCDDFCPETTARIWAGRAGARLALLPGADHFLSGARETLARAFAGWPIPDPLVA